MAPYETVILGCHGADGKEGEYTLFLPSDAKTNNLICSDVPFAKQIKTENFSSAVLIPHTKEQSLRRTLS